MKFIFLFIINILVIDNIVAQRSTGCSTNNFTPNSPLTVLSLSDKKIVRVNIHFMLKTDGTGNFRELDDGDGRTSYNGYIYANDMISWMNEASAWNPKLNIPTGNNITQNPKNFAFVLDAVYFWRNDNTYNFNTVNYLTQGKDKDNVINIFLSYGNSTGSGYASNIDPNSKEKYTENRSYWTVYKNNISAGNPFGWFLHGTSVNTLHELGHLLGLSHTVMYSYGVQCPTSCTTSVPVCGDACDDTPSANEIMNANNCTKHPHCGWGTGSIVDCSNNLMDYSGDHALSPCQINIIHSSLEGGMKTYLSCQAVASDLSLCDIGYPKVSYFGKNISVGCVNTMAHVTNNEKIKLYFSESIELNNFEVRSDSEVEFIEEAVCGF
jgi:hypothetical protein